MLPFFSFPSWMTWFASGGRVSEGNGAAVLEPTGSKHSLNKVVDIAQNDAIALRAALTWSPKRLYLHTLEDGHRELSAELFLVVEDGAVVCQLKNVKWISVHTGERPGRFGLTQLQDLPF